MAEINLSTFIYAGVLGLFILLGINGFMLDISDGHNVEGIAEIQQDFEIYENRTQIYRERGDQLKTDTTNLPSDSDAIDVEGNFIVTGWNAARNAITGTKDLVTSSLALLTNGLEKLNVPTWVFGLLTGSFFIGLFIIGIKIAIERRGT